MNQSYNEVSCSKGKKVKNFVTQFIHDEDGLGVVELVLIIIILIGLVILFKDKVTEFIEDLFKDATENKKQL